MGTARHSWSPTGPEGEASHPGILGNWIKKERLDRTGNRHLARTAWQSWSACAKEVKELRMERDILKRSVVLG